MVWQDCGMGWCWVLGVGCVRWGHSPPVYLLFGAIYWSSTHFKGWGHSRPFEGALTSICGCGGHSPPVYLSFFVLYRSTQPRVFCHLTSLLPDSEIQLLMPWSYISFGLTHLYMYFSDMPGSEGRPGSEWGSWRDLLKRPDSADEEKKDDMKRSPTFRHPSFVSINTGLCTEHA